MPTTSKTTGMKASTNSSIPQQPFSTLTVRQALSRPKSKFLVQDYIAENSINFIVGPPGSGKSFFALDLALELIRPTLGLMAEEWPILKPCNVLYMTDEGIAEIASDDGRLISLLAHKGLYNKPTDTLHHTTDNLMIVEDMLNLFIDINDNLNQNQRYLDFLAQFLAFRPDVIFVDTYANSVIGADENDNKAANIIGENMRILKGIMNCALILNHHTAKGIVVSKGNPYVGRGAGSLGGFSDTIIGIMPDSKNEDCSIIHHCKAKHSRLQPSRIMTRESNSGYYYPFLTYKPYSDKVEQQIQKKDNSILN